MEAALAPEVDRWLREDWNLQLDWDNWNIPKLEKHTTTLNLVESLFDNDFVFAGRIVATWNFMGRRSLSNIWKAV